MFLKSLFQEGRGVRGRGVGGGWGGGWGGQKSDMAGLNECE